MMAPSARSRFPAILVLLVVGAALNAVAATMEVRRAYIGHRGTVHIVTEDGRNARVAGKGRNEQVRLSKNREVVAWISRPGKDGDSLKVYHGGKIQTIQAGPFVRDFWFVDDGTKIAVNIGGMHFAGTEFLYDVATRVQLDEVKEWEVPWEKRPAWSTER